MYALSSPFTSYGNVTDINDKDKVYQYPLILSNEQLISNRD